MPLLILPFIKAPQGTKVNHPKDITNLFRPFYSSMYNLYSKDPLRTSHSRINKIAISIMSTLDPAIRSELDTPISQDEIQTAINCLPSAKTPVPDGPYSRIFSSI